MPKKLLRRWVPSQEKMAENSFMRRFAHWFTDARLWHLNRRSVSGAVAVGMVAGLIPGPLQVISAALMSLLFRVNLPLAALTTFFSNPLTIGPIYWVAYKLGSVLIGANGRTALPPLPSLSDLGLTGWMHAMMDWMWSLGMPLAVGLPALAILLALGGYLITDQLWRLHVRCEVSQRRRRAQNGT